MNPKSIIACIEKNREVLEAQARRVQDIVPQPARTHRTNDEEGNAAQLLSEHVMAQLATAADWLRAMTDAETAVRAGSRSADDKASNSTIIETDYKEVQA
jgi:hypothetical protein